MNNNTADYESNNSKSLVSGKELAEILDVSASTLSEAVKKGYNCGGYPIGEWAEFNRFGRVDGYDVPDFLLKEYQKDEKSRSNPNSDEPDEEQNVKKPQELSVINNYSLVPTGENLTHPAGMVSLPLVLKKAIEFDTPQSRAVIGGTLALLGAITANSITDSGVAAGIGAGVGLGIALYFFNNAKNQNIEPLISRSMAFENSTSQQLPQNQRIIHSDFLVN